MYQLTEYGKHIVAQYTRQMPYLLTVTIPFATYQSASAQTNQFTSDEATDDVLITEIGVNFLNALVRISIVDNSQYQWMQNNTFAPIHTIAGAATQVSPILPIPIEYFLPKNNRFTFQFINASSSPETVDRYLTMRGIRLKDRITAKS